MAKVTTRKSDPSKKKIFIVEDHPAFREGLAQIVTSEPDLAVCGKAGDAIEAFEQIKALKPDLVLVDITLPGKSGLELIKELRQVNRKVKLLVVSMHDEALYADRVLRAGGDGYIMKQEDPEEIVQAIRDVLDGHIYVSEEVMASRKSAGGTKKSQPKEPVRLLDQLSDTELEILALYGQGKSNEEIMKQLELDDASVAEHSKQIKKKLGLKTENEMIRYAVCWVETGAS